MTRRIAFLPVFVTVLLGLASAPPLNSGQPNPGSMYFTVTPCRLLDTRASTPLADGTVYPVTAIGPPCGIPSGAAAVALNVVAVSPTSGGHLTLYPGASVPATATMNFNAGNIRANNAVVNLDAAGGFNILPTLGGGTLNVVIDVAGYFVQLPQGVDDIYSTPKNTPLNVVAPGVLGNDFGTNLQAVPINGPTPHGTVNLAANGSFTYTPTNGYTGADAFTYTVQNAAGSSTATVNLTISCPAITVNPATLPGGTAGTAYSQSISAVGGTGPYTFTITSGSQPNGLTLNPGTGVLSGTPTAANTFNFTVTATDANACTGSTAYSVTIVCPAVSVTPPTLPGGVVGTLYSQPLAGSGGTAPYTFTVTAGTLPNNVTLNAGTGLLSGPPTLAGLFNFTITATDANLCPGSQAYSVRICPVVTVTPATLPDGVINVPYPTQTVVGNGGVGPYTFSVSAGTLPSGLNLNTSTGDITGTPDTLVTSNFRIRATDQNGCFGETAYTVRTCVAQAMTPPGGALASGTTGVPYSSGVTASGGAGPYTYAVTSGALPTNVNLNVNTGALTGTPTVAGPFNFTITATDGPTGCTVSGAYSIKICPPITVNPATLPAGTLGIPYSQTVSGSGGTGPYTFAVTAGALPTNVNLDTNTGVISGTPNTASLFNFTITATDANGCTGSRAYSVRICPVVSVTPATLPAGKVGTAYNQTVAGSGGTAPYTFAVTSGALPNPLGLNSSTGAITGTPATANLFNFTITATDTNGCAGGTAYSVRICPVLSITPAVPATPIYQVAYNQALTGVGGTGPYTISFASGTLPAGLSISGNALTGTPTNTGVFNFSLTVTDANGCSDTQAFSVTTRPNAQNDSFIHTVGNTQLVVNTAPPSTPAVFVNSATGVLANDNGPGSLSASGAVVGGIGGAVALNANGTFTYTPPVNTTGTATFTYTLTDGNGITNTAGATIVVDAPIVWYIDSASVGTHDGRSNTPFLNLGPGAGNLGSVTTNNGDFIYVAKGAATTIGAYTMKPSQSLIGAGANLAVGNLSVPGAAANTPTLTGTLTLANSATVNGIDMSTGASNAIAGSGVTGISVTARTVATTTGIAINLTGAGNTGTMTFRSVSANGASSGIALQNLTGGFTVTGDGTNNASGGTIQSTTGDGILLSNAQNVSLTSMSIQSTAHSGVKGSNNVQTFSFINGTINNSGTASGTGDSNIAFNAGAYAPTVGNEKNLTGTLTITGSTLTDAFYHGIDVFQFDGTITNTNISNNTITSSTNIAVSKGSGIRLVGFGSASTVASYSKATINQNTITNFPSDAGIFFAGGNGTSAGAPAGTYGTDTASNAFAVTNNTISGQSAVNQMGTQGINTALNGRGTGSFLITGNSITNVKGIGINTGSNGLTTYTAIITANTIVAHNIFSSAGIGGGTTNTFSSSDTPTYNVRIGDGTAGGANHISQTDGNGILINAISATGKANVRILTNTVTAPTNGSGTTYGIRVAAGNLSSVNDAVCLEISGNTTAGDTDGLGTTAPGIGLRKQGTNPVVNAFGIVGLPGGSTASPNVEIYVNSQNPGSASGSFGTGGTALISATSGFSTCVEPPGVP